MSIHSTVYHTAVVLYGVIAWPLCHLDVTTLWLLVQKYHKLFKIRERRNKTIYMHSDITFASTEWQNFIFWMRLFSGHCFPRSMFKISLEIHLITLYIESSIKFRNVITTSEYSLTLKQTGLITEFKAAESMMTSSNGNIFRVTGHLCGEFTGRRWIPHTKASDPELWCFLLSAPG